MTIEDIEIAVSKHWGIRAHVVVPNASWGAGVHECDLLILTNSGYLTEIEIKTTKADLVKDLKKEHGHRSDRIKKLYYAMPDTVLHKNGTLSLIPEGAGVLRVWKSEYGEAEYCCTVEREATANGRAKPLTADEQFQIARLGAMRIWDLKKRLQLVRQAMK